MKITRQLRLDALAADGTSPIHLPITWEGNRLRLSTGAVVRPEHRDAEARQGKAQRGTPHASIDSRLSRALPLPTQPSTPISARGPLIF